MASAAKKLDISVLGGLYSVTEENLLSHLNITDTESKTKRQVLKPTRNAIKTGVQAKSEEEAVECFKVLQSFIFDAPLSDETEDREKNAEITHLEKKLAAMEAEEKQISDLKLKLHNLQLGNHAHSLVAEVEEQNVAEKPLDVNLDTNTSLFRRELKILGSVGHSNETNKSTFISLIHQIDVAVAKGYHDIEICEAIMKAISPGMTLRGFLQCKRDLNLLILRKILRSHFKEKSATYLYKSLTALAQLPNKDPQTFLFRGLELRQKYYFCM